MSEAPRPAGDDPQQLLRAAQAAGVFSAAVVRVDDLAADRCLLELALGRASFDDDAGAIGAHTAFDLASLTKLFTATLTLRLVVAGALDLDDDVGDLLASPRHAGITVRHLLEHRSGLPAWAPLYERAWPGRPDRVGVSQGALALDREAEPGARHCYSDIGFLVLLEVLERAGGGFVAALHREVLAPLGIDADFRGVGGGPERAAALARTGAVAATERCPDRGLVCGEVHDRNTWARGGVAGHAGLFGPASAVAALARGWWRAPQTGYLPRALRDEAWGPPRSGGTHVLGWDTVSPGGSSAGTRLSASSHGHLGFTGTSLWVDPERRWSVVVLSNRVHPSRDDDRIRALRPTLHDALVARLGG